MSIDAKISIKEQKYWVALSTFLKFGQRRLNYLHKHFPNMEAAYHASLGELVQANIPETVALEFINHRKNINPDVEIEKLYKQNIKFCILPLVNEPNLITEMPDAPIILYYQGNLNLSNNKCLAVVGSRKYSLYGQRTAEYIIKDCVQNQMVIVSGLALGIDAISHNACIKHNGRTIAVLGSGVDKLSIYPATNRYLADKILATGGAIVSEFPIGTPALKHHFPQRNRIIAGMSRGTLVVEASEKSGALITAKYALEYNREVFAIPGSIFNENAKGTNRLLQSGAKLVISAQDILEEFNPDYIIQHTQNTHKQFQPNNELEAKIVAVLDNNILHINNIAKLTKLDTSVVNATLLIMELQGYVNNLGSGNYSL